MRQVQKRGIRSTGRGPDPQLQPLAGDRDLQLESSRKHKLKGAIYTRLEEGSVRMHMTAGGASEKDMKREARAEAGFCSCQEFEQGQERYQVYI